MAFESKNYSPDQFSGVLGGIELENMHEDGVTIEFQGERSSAIYGLNNNAVLVNTTRTPVLVTVAFMPDAPEIHLILASHKAGTLFDAPSFLKQIGTNEQLLLMGCTFQNKGQLRRAVQNADDVGAVEMSFLFGDSEEL